jgi:septal ring factor EnvC (AmiA/AmiB activator)
LKKIEVDSYPEGEFNAENILAQALVNAAEAKDFKDNEKLYDFIEDTPKGSLIAHIVDELQELGYTIKPIKSETDIIKHNLEVSKKELKKIKNKIKQLEKK